jgi:hypothetical protein
MLRSDGLQPHPTFSVASLMSTSTLWDQVVVPSTDQVSARLGDGEVVLLNFRCGEYFGLNRTGAMVWEMVTDQATLGEIRAAILHRYEIEPSQCESDLLALVGELQAEGLVVFRDGEQGREAGESGGG